MRRLIRVYCEKDSIVDCHYVMIEVNSYTTLKEIEDRIKKDKLGKILRIDFL